jgi:hypothetical protein
MPHDQLQQLIEHLDALNARLARQYSFRHMFVSGVLYGIGFVVGSAIIATVAIGVFGPYFARIPWVRAAYEAGAQLIQQR